MCSGRSVIRQSFRFELDPNQTQRVLLAKTVGARRYVYNWGLDQARRDNERLDRLPHLGELKARLVGLKKRDCPWLYEVSAHAGQQALVDLDRAFQRYFKGLRGDGPQSGFPRFKRKGERDSARLYGVKLLERHIRLPMIGQVRMKESRSKRGFDGHIVSATVRRRADRWFVLLAVERDCELSRPKPIRRPSDVVGVDLGLRSAAVIHDGTGTWTIAPRHALRKNLARLARVERRLARTRKGSRNREKMRLRKQRLHYQISCQRQDFLHQLSSSLARTKRVIVVEDLLVRGMQRNKHLALSIGDAGMGELRRQLAYKCRWYGATLISANRFYPSSKACSRCGVVKHTLSLSERVFDCDGCGLSLDRDENAAINLRKLGLAVLPEGLREVTPVEREALTPAIACVKLTSAKQEATASGTDRSTRRRTSKGVRVRA